MTTGEWLRYLSNVDGTTALDHFLSIRRQPNELYLTVCTDNVRLNEEKNMVLYDLDTDVIKLEDEANDIIELEEKIIQIEDKEVLNGLC